MNSILTEEKQEKKDTGKKTDIIVCGDGEKQRDGIKEELAIPQQRDRTERDQRKQRKGVEPHNVPLVSQCPGAQSVETAKKRDRQIILTECFL